MGCALDLNARTISFSLGGSMDPPMGVAFRLPSTWHPKTITPALSTGGLNLAGRFARRVLLLQPPALQHIINCCFNHQWHCVMIWRLDVQCDLGTERESSTIFPQACGSGCRCRACGLYVIMSRWKRSTAYFHVIFINESAPQPPGMLIYCVAAAGYSAVGAFECATASSGSSATAGTETCIGAPGHTGKALNPVFSPMLGSDGSAMRVALLRRDDIVLGEELGRGGFGIVFRGTYMDTSVALKVMQVASEEGEHQFLREIETQT